MSLQQGTPYASLSPSFQSFSMPSFPSMPHQALLSHPRRKHPLRIQHPILVKREKQSLMRCTVDRRLLEQHAAHARAGEPVSCRCSNPTTLAHRNPHTCAQLSARCWQKRRGGTRAALLSPYLALLSPYLALLSPYLALLSPYLALLSPWHQQAACVTSRGAGVGTTGHEGYTSRGRVWQGEGGWGEGGHHGDAEEGDAEAGRLARLVGHAARARQLGSGPRARCECESAAASR